MRQNHRIGGIAALIAAGTFVFGFVMAVTTLSEYAIDEPEPAEAVAFVADNQAALYIWHSVILILFGIVLVPLVLALARRMKGLESVVVPTASLFGVIWAGLVLASGMIATVGLDAVVDLHGTDPAAAQSLWSAVDAVQFALGGGIEIVGGLWVLLVSAAALQSNVLPRRLNYLGLAAGVAGIITVVPPLADVGAVFGIGLIIWFVWVGSVLLRDERNPIAVAPPLGE